MKELEGRVKEYLVERGWDNLRPSDLAKSIMIEGAELLEIFQWDNLSATAVKNDLKKISKIKKELADIIIYCLDMAVTLEIDVQEILDENLKHIKKKYPVNLVKNIDGIEPGTDEVYWNIKKQYRKAN